MSPFFVRFLALFAIVAGLVGVKRVYDSYETTELYRKDFIQEYVLARAVLVGDYPYPPVKTLVDKFIVPAPEIPWDHPTPHTPPAALLSVPVGFFEYPVAVTVWLLFELSCLAGAVEILSRAWGERVTWLQKGAIFLLCLGLGPVISDLWYGQFSLVLLLLLSLAWTNLRDGKDGAGGLGLGVAIALKLAGGPIAIYLVLRGRWRAVGAAALVIVLLNLAAMAAIGPGAVADYYRVVGPAVSAQYRQHSDNFSLWSIGSRFFGSMTGIYSNFFTARLYESETLAQIVTPALPLLALVGSLVLAWRCRQFDSAFGVLLCASLPISPVAWDHYLILTAIPIVVLARRLKDAAYPRALTATALVFLGISVFPNATYVDLKAFATRIDGRMYEVPFWLGLLTYLPLIPIVGWIVLLQKTDDTARIR